MELVAIPVFPSTINTIKLLNSGVTPEIESEPTWFVFDSAWNSEHPNEIVTEAWLKRHGSEILRLHPE